MEQDVLVVMEDTDVARMALADLRIRGQVTQLLPPRLALVAAGAVAAGTPGLSVHTGERPDLDDPTDAEQLFVDAWWERRRGKDRPGDGLPWDAPGYRPPG